MYEFIRTDKSDYFELRAVIRIICLVVHLIFGFPMRSRKGLYLGLWGSKREWSTEYKYGDDALTANYILITFHWNNTLSKLQQISERKWNRFHSSKTSSNAAHKQLEYHPYVQQHNHCTTVLWFLLSIK